MAPGTRMEVILRSCPDAPEHSAQIRCFMNMILKEFVSSKFGSFLQ